MASHYDSSHGCTRFHVHLSSWRGRVFRQPRSGRVPVSLQAEWPTGFVGNDNGDGLVLSEESADGSGPRQFQTVSGHQVGISDLYRYTAPGSAIRAEQNVLQ